jgi:hypothetical protein
MKFGAIDLRVKHANNVRFDVFHSGNNEELCFLGYDDAVWLL